MRKPLLDNLRYAAHVRHAALNYACWWWNPPMLTMARLTHRAVVDGFYDSLEDAMKEENHERSNQTENPTRGNRP